jgi:hypothetical protein
MLLNGCFVLPRSDNPFIEDIIQGLKVLHSCATLFGYYKEINLCVRPVNSAKRF